MPRRGILFGLGGIAFAIGVGLLALGAYNVFFGDDGPPVSNAPVLAASDLQSQTAVSTPSASSPTPTPVPPLGDEPYQMIIDKLGVKAPVQTFGLDENQVPETPSGPVDE